MKIFSNKKKLVKLISGEKNLGFVPTMGAIHVGHISLIKRSIKENNKTLVSIFVNKPQFNRRSDYVKYPRSLSTDIKHLKKLKIDYLFVPNSKQIYPVKKKEKIKITPFSKKLCGKDRPGHFNAVVDVLKRFIEIIRPKKIYLGKKDFQQFKIVQHFFKKNKIKTKVIGCKIIREKNGIAYSSRNSLLSSKEIIIASKIYKKISTKKKNMIKNKKFFKKIKKEILKLKISKLDYLKIININKIIKPYKKNKKFRIFIAYNLGGVRLIDNI